MRILLINPNTTQALTDRLEAAALGVKSSETELVCATALLYASSGPYPDTVGLLLRNGADANVQGKTEGFTALMTAASEGQMEVARVLLLNGAQIDIMDKDGDTAKTFARENGHSAMLELLERQPVKSPPP